MDPDHEPKKTLFFSKLWVSGILSQWQGKWLKQWQKVMNTTNENLGYSSGPQLSFSCMHKKQPRHNEESKPWTSASPLWSSFRNNNVGGNKLMQLLKSRLGTDDWPLPVPIRLDCRHNKYPRCCISVSHHVKQLSITMTKSLIKLIQEKMWFGS